MSSILIGVTMKEKKKFKRKSLLEDSIIHALFDDFSTLYNLNLDMKLHSFEIHDEIPSNNQRTLMVRDINGNIVKTFRVFLRVKPRRNLKDVK
jgi:hypothetical protein